MPGSKRCSVGIPKNLYSFLSFLGARSGKFITWVYFFGLVIPLILSGWLAFNNTRDLDDETLMVARTNMVIDNLSSTLGIIIGAEASQRGYILTNNATYLKPYTDSIAAIRKNMDELPGIVTDEKQAKSIPILDELIKYKLLEMKSILALKGQKSQIRRIDKNLGMSLMNSIRSQTDQMISYEIYLLSCRESVYRHSYHRAFKYGTIFSLFGLALLSVTLLHLRKFVLELSISKSRAEQASTAKSAFLASMSHELRTPLTAIMMYSEMVLDDIKDDPTKAQSVHDLGYVLKSGETLINLIDDILDLAKVEAGRVDISCEEVSLKDILDLVLLQANPLMEKNHNTLMVDTEAADGLMLFTDKKRVRQIILNLLSNAAKFTKKGTVSLITRVTDKSVIFKVVDTGIGMTEEQATHIWHEFEQANETISRRYGGTGLGLALTKRFTQGLQGSVTMESVYGEGSTFTIVLPQRSHNGENTAR